MVGGVDRGNRGDGGDGVDGGEGEEEGGEFLADKLTDAQVHQRYYKMSSRTLK